MTKRIGGMRRKTRYKLKKSVSEKGKMSLKKYFQIFSEGDRVVLAAEPAYQKGMFHPRFYGLVGTVIKKTSEKTDSCYEVSIKDKSKEKTVIVHPVHMKKLEVQAWIMLQFWKKTQLVWVN